MLLVDADPRFASEGAVLGVGRCSEGANGASGMVTDVGIHTGANTDTHTYLHSHTHTHDIDRLRKKRAKAKERTKKEKER